MRGLTDGARQQARSRLDITCQTPMMNYHREPQSITLDGHQPSHSALRRMGMNGEFNFRPDIVPGQ